ncbi:MAG: hypothetical protein PUC63_00785 [Clostridiales bacterium]|nr:hypothetical protein [Clostridiales bacterium]
MKPRFIDIHAHILPGLDDGAETIEDSIELARIAESNGVAIIIATPHSYDHNYEGSGFAEEVCAAAEYTQECINEAGINVKLLTGMEIFADRDTPRLLRSGDLLPLAGTRYALTEFSFDEEPIWVTDVLREAIAAGYIPVIAHPERYNYVRENPGIAYNWVRGGCLLQINRGSLIGRFGPDARSTALRLLRHGLVSFTATDAHSPVARTTTMSDAYAELKSLLGSAAAEELTCTNAIKLIRGEIITLPNARPFYSGTEIF